MTYEKSMICYDHAEAISGHSLTRSKAPGKMFEIGAGPMYADHGSGAVVFDVDGNPFIDMVCALGAVSLGYTHHRSAGAAVREIEKGWLYSLPHRVEGEAAEAILSRVAPWAYRVRFVKTGSEATHAAYRIAKAATGRSHIIVASNAYHGWHEAVSFETDAARVSLSGTAWRYKYGVDWSRVTFDYIDPSKVAAVFVEPARWEDPNPDGWLERTAQFWRARGALVVFDEMIYGCRWALGGASEYFGVTPDLACFGKAIGNGAPLACVVGNRVLSEHGQIVSGTYSGDVAALSACVGVLETYRHEPVIETLWKRGRQLQRGLRWAIETAGVEAVIEGAPVHQRILFPNDDDKQRGRAFCQQMAARGVLFHPDLCNLSYAHTPEQIEQVVEAAAESLKALG